MYTNYLLTEPEARKIYSPGKLETLKVLFKVENERMNI